MEEPSERALALADDITARVSRILQGAAKSGQQFRSHIRAGSKAGLPIPGMEDCVNHQHDGSFDIHISVEPFAVGSLSSWPCETQSANAVDAACRSSAATFTEISMENQ